MEKIIWKNEKRKVNDLKPFENNPRKATEKEIQGLSESLEKFDLADPLVINTDGRVVGGNFRLSLLRQRGIKEVDVRVPNRTLTKEEANELNLRLNKNLGLWDNDVLAKFSEDMLKNVGFSQEEMDQIFGLDISDEFDEQKEFEKAIKEPRGVQNGDIWELGDHRLIIGDCTKRENWEKLLGNERFDFLFTDPPYRLNYVKNRFKGRMRTKKGIKIRRERIYLGVGETDKKGKPKGFGYKQNRMYTGIMDRGVPEYDEWLSIANEFQNPIGANVMVFENWKNTVDLWQAVKKYWKIKNMIIWWLPNRHQGFGCIREFYHKYDIAPLADKGKAVQNDEYEKEFDEYLAEHGQRLLDTYEVILYGQQGHSIWDFKKGGKWSKVCDHISNTAESEAGSGDSVVFGKKPIQILVPYIKTLSQREGIVVDPFGGSGSTMIASEILKRKCRLIEIVPVYGEVILNRFQKFTGIEPKKIN